MSLRLALDRVFHPSNAAHIRALLLDFDLVEFVAAWALSLLDLDVLVQAIDRLLLDLKREFLIDVVRLRVMAALVSAYTLVFTLVVWLLAEHDLVKRVNLSHRLDLGH